MKNTDEDSHNLERVTELYVAVFPVKFNDDLKVEVILSGFIKDPRYPNASQVRATVETHINAVPDLVSLCDKIVYEQAEIESYRLLKFDKDGVHILNTNDFRDPEMVRISETTFVSSEWGTC